MDNNQLTYLMGLKDKIAEKAKEEAELTGKLKQLECDMKKLGVKSIDQLDKKHNKVKDEIDEIDEELEEIYESVREKLA